MGLFIKKPLEALQAEANQTGSKSLKRVLGPWSLVALGVGVIIGAGLFSITGTVAAGYTGPAITLSFAIAAIGCCFAGLCYAEFASMIPVAGSAYTYSSAGAVISSSFWKGSESTFRQLALPVPGMEGLSISRHS